MRIEMGMGGNGNGNVNVTGNAGCRLRDTDAILYASN